MKKLTGTTKTGFQFAIEEEARDDMELLEGFSAITQGDLSALPRLIECLLGNEQKAALYDHCRGKSGRVSSKKVMAELLNIFEAIKEDGTEIKN